ncbi:ATP-binding protein [Aquifex aeolicus]|uniref:AAA+ ATPase domain-containing protein n=1 Tax=Aquifex aeolicus (strain VF5) TaxID=224324 RepID=O67486_AQUAE|nr:DNA polymerase III subunit delta' [Aquifex aeolicus]AAC07454.1 hypothetical protein aq_1526 [Aquifex aeolicus VF5]
MEKVFLEKLQKTLHIPGGLLFYGKEGSGKTKTAFEFAKGILCKENVPWGCGSCPSCKHVNELEEAFFKGEIEDFKVYKDKDGKKHFVYLMGEHPDFVVIIPSGHYIKIEQIREVKNFAYVKPALSRRKVIIIDDAHAMTSQAANALLKVLEEPPADTTFILTTNRRSAILPTILSRTFQVEFKGFSVKEVMEIAKVDEEIAKLSGGSLKRAILLKENKDILNKVKEFLENEPLKVYKLASEFEKWEPEKQKLFLEIMEELVSQKLTEEKKDNYTYLLDTIRLFKDGLARGVNEPLWLFTLAVQAD